MKLFSAALALFAMALSAHAETFEISSVKELAEAAARSGNTVRMKPGVYKMSDYYTKEVAATVAEEQPKGPGRQPSWMIRFSGNQNSFDFTGVEIEIDTTLYPLMPKGYARCLWISGSNNTLTGLTIRNTGPQQGNHGNILSMWGSGNTLTGVTLYVSGSKPYGYGDLLGKGGPNITGLQKQSGIMISGRDNTAKRCRVISRAFGHCFYIQNAGDLLADNIRLEDCYAEGTVRSTADMLRETSGLLADLNFSTIACNRDGRYLVVAGYMKSLSEDGFRTYGGTCRVQLINCTAVNTRAGFEVNGPDDGDGKTIVDGGSALGCERAYLVGGNVIVRNSRGDTRYGPLLYLRGGKDSQIDLELVSSQSDYTVHALATIAGEGHTVRLFTREPAERPLIALPIMLGYAMPADAEMSCAIKPAAARNIALINQLPRMQVIQSSEATDVKVESSARIIADEDAKKLLKK